jgi:hypothetical protein
MANAKKRVFPKRGKRSGKKTQNQIDINNEILSRLRK